MFLMTRILSSLFYINSMRKTSEEFNNDRIIENIWMVCGGKPAADEIPYWKTINRYLEKLEPEGLQDIIRNLCRRLLCSRAFENMHIRDKYWQIIIDGTQLHSTRGDWMGKACTASITKGWDQNTGKTIIMC